MSALKRLIEMLNTKVSLEWSRKRRGFRLLSFKVRTLYKRNKTFYCEVCRFDLFQIRVSFEW